MTAFFLFGIGGKIGLYCRRQQRFDKASLSGESDIPADETVSRHHHCCGNVFRVVGIVQHLIGNDCYGFALVLFEVEALLLL